MDADIEASRRIVSQYRGVFTGPPRDVPSFHIVDGPITGNGDVVEPENNLMAVGSGGAYAQAAARALMDNTELDARTIAEKALKIAADICIYTNHNLTLEELDAET